MSWEKEYPNHKLWGNKSWAWQFLKRDKDFISDCKAVEALKGIERKLEENKIARKYGLRIFIPYDKKINEVLYPVILFNPISYWVHEDWSEQEEILKTEKEQVVVVFDLLKTLDDKLALDEQVDYIKKILEEQRDEMIKSNEYSFNKKKKRMWSKNYLRHLKVIDERNKGTKWAEIAKMVFPEGVVDKSGFKLYDDEITRKYYKMLKSSLSKTKEYRAILRDKNELSFAERRLNYEKIGHQK